MSKFSIGDRVQVMWSRAPSDPICKRGVGEIGIISSIGPFLPGHEYENAKTDSGGDYRVKFDNPRVSRSGYGTYIESQLRKIPSQDSSEDLGLTRLKKLLLQDTKRKEREHESS